MSAVGGYAGWPHSDWYASRARRLSILMGVGAIALAVAYATAIVVSDGDRLLVLPLVVALVAIAVFARPAFGVYLLLGSALLFEQSEISGIAPITAQVHMFQNISSYTGLPLRLSIADLLILLTLASWAAKRLAARATPLRWGPLGWGIAAYGGAFAIGAVIGAARGGWDPNAALAEVRGPLDLCLLYFLAANLIRDRRQIAILMGTIVLLVGVKAVQGILNYEEAQNLSYALDSVTGHEDVVFFDLALALGLMIAVLGVRSKLAYVLLALQPLILGAELLAQRRVGFIALGTAVLVVMLLALAGNPRRGLLLAAVGMFVVGGYVALFWDQGGTLGEPARAVRGVVDDSSLSLRDELSNAWRDIENRNIAYTVGQLPLTGVGLGQEYLFREEPPPLPASFTYWRYATHNAVLWLWLKAGPLGAFALWFLVARVILLGSAAYLRLRDPWLRWVVVVPVALIAIQIVFSSVDLGLTYDRTMIVLGTALGMGATVIERSGISRSSHAGDGDRR